MLKQIKKRKEEPLLEDKNTFSKFMTEKRIAAGLTQKELAERLYVSDSTVSKWERGLSYPDITLISQICKELNITEHEFITASDDFAGRMEKKQAKHYRSAVKTGWLLLNGGYAVALLVCFICNLAIQHTLSWFFIVLAAIALTFSVTTLPSLLRKHRLLITFAAATVLIYLLLLVCSLYTGGGWFLSAAVPIASVSLTCPWFLLLIFKYAKINTFLKVGIALVFLGIFTLGINPFIAFVLGLDLEQYLWYLDPMVWVNEQIANKIIFTSLLAVGTGFTIAGTVRAIRTALRSR